GGSFAAVVVAVAGAMLVSARRNTRVRLEELEKHGLLGSNQLVVTRHFEIPTRVSENHDRTQQTGRIIGFGRGAVHFVKLARSAANCDRLSRLGEFLVSKWFLTNGAAPPVDVFEVASGVAG